MANKILNSGGRPKGHKKEKKKKDTHTTTDFSTLRENAAKKNHKGMIKTKVISKQPGEKRAINGSKELEQSKPKKCCQTITNTSMIKTMFAPT